MSLADGFVDAVTDGSLLVAAPVAAAAGLVSFLSPCVLPLVPGYLSFVTGEKVLAELREDFVENTLALPVGVVESAGSGDLLTRTSRDVEQLGDDLQQPAEHPAGQGEADDRRQRDQPQHPPLAPGELGVGEQPLSLLQKVGQPQRRHPELHHRSEPGKGSTAAANRGVAR